MYKLIFSIILLLPSCLYAQDSSHSVSDSVSEVRVFELFEDMEHIFNYENDTTYLINFWATWCKPCVAELPYIDSLTDHYSQEKFKVILVSLDFEKQIESKLIPYINKNHIQSECVLLADGKANRWIDKVDKSWSGSIPITLIYNKDNRLFYEKEFHSKKELVNIIQPLISNNEK